MPKIIRKKRQPATKKTANTSAETGYTVSGKVRFADGRAHVGGKVRAFDRDLRSEKLLGETVTDNKGFYQLKYTEKSFIKREQGSADLLVRAFDKNGKKVVATSELIFNVEKQATVNLVVDNEEFRGLAEYDALIEQLKPLLGKMKISTLVENEEHNDISFLAGETGLESSVLSLLPLAHQFEDKTKISAEIHYALMRVGFPVALKKILEVKSQSIKEGVIKAIENNIIGEKWRKKLKSVIAQFNQLASKSVLTEKTANNLAFKKMLGSVVKGSEAQNAFVNTFLENEAAPDKLFKKLATQPGFENKKTISDLKHLLQLNVITANVPALTSLLFKEKINGTQVETVREFSEFTRSDWEKRIDKISSTEEFNDFPDDVKGKTKKQKVKHYAELLDRQMTDLFPTDVFNHRLSKDTRAVLSVVKSDLTQFLKNNNEFDLKTTKIKADLNQASFTGIANKPKLVNTLTDISRLYKLAPDYEQTSALLDDGLNSASAIVRKYTATQFVEKFSDKIGQQTASHIHREAKRVDHRSSLLTLNLKTSSDIPSYALLDSENLSPDYQSMFNDNYLCECEHCQSVNSPSAYLVDMLNFINENNAQAKKSLDTRRPDIQHTLLTCKNTNTVLPYIDLSNEILEDFISPSGIQAHSTTNSADELAAYPEHVNQAAYNVLAEATGAEPLPANLPINIALEESRQYISKLSTTRLDLMEIFYGNKDDSKYKDIAIATEALGLSVQDLAELNKQIAISVADIEIVSDFLERSSLTYVELLQLLECNFINPRLSPLSNPDDIAESTRVITIVSTDNELPAICDVNKLRLEGLTVSSISSIFPFLRLSRYLGWEMVDLDRMLTAFNIDAFPMSEANFNKRLILPLSHIVRLMDQFNLDVADTLSLWVSIDSEIYRDHSKQVEVFPSLYMELFQNKQISNPLDPDLVDPLNLDEQLSLVGKSALITAAYNLSESDLNLLMQSLSMDDSLNMVNLSLLYRYSILAKSLRLSIESLIPLVDFSGIEPFGDISNTDSLLDFLDVVLRMRASGFTGDELDVLLKENSDLAVVNDNSVMLALTALREGLQKIELQFDEIEITPQVSEDKFLAQSQVIADSLGAEFDIDASIIIAMSNGMVKSSDNESENAITQFINESFIQSSAPIATVMGNETDWLFPNLVSTTIEIYRTGVRITQLLTKLSLSVDEFIYFQANAALFNITGIWNLPTGDEVTDRFRELENLIQLTEFRNTLINRSDNWYLLFDLLVTSIATNKEAFIDALVELTGAAKEDFESLLGSSISVTEKGFLNYGFPADYANAKTLLNVMSCIVKSDNLGSTPAIVSNLCKADITFDEAAVARSILKAKYSPTDWLDRIKPISNDIRKLKRDALVSHILSSSDKAEFRAENKIENANDLFQYFLIDIEMAPCMLTSRIKQVNNSVQLYIDRCLLNLEVDTENDNKIELGEEFSEQWYEWRKQYRVWEANRKVFLYPENWIEPDLRDDKSPFFKELESKLSQNEITAETAKDALLEYLEKLDTIANLEVIGLFPDEETGIDHVFGRTKTLPHQYYYRTQEKSLWTVWEKVELDIEGDHIVPVVWNGRLMLFWGVFTEKQKEGDNGNVFLYFEIKLCWSEYKNGNWSAKRITQQYSETFDPAIKIDKPEVSINTRIINDVLSLYTYFVWHNDAYQYSLGVFEFDFCNNMINHSKLNYKFRTYYHPDFITQGTFFTKADGINNFSLFNGGPFRFESNSDSSINEIDEILEKNITEYQILPNHHEIATVKPIKFSLKVNKSNFYVSSHNKNVFEKELFGDGRAVATGFLSTRESTTPVIPEPVVPGLPVTQPLSANLIRGGRVLAERAPLLDAVVPPAIEVLPPSGSLYKQKKVYKFQLFYHPYVCKYIKDVNTGGIKALYNVDNQDLPDSLSFRSKYSPTESVSNPDLIEQVDFSFSGAYSVYNWELFFHIPLLIATRLSKNQKYEEAREWFHYIFNPTKSSQASLGSSENESGLKRFWITKPFKKEIDNQALSIEELINGDDAQVELSAQLDYWESNPFKPHGIARLRHSAYMRTTLMKYIDNLMEWGDTLFRRDTIESTNEATLLYVMAANLLGKKPEAIPPRAKTLDFSYSTISSSSVELNDFSSAKLEIESYLSHSAPSLDTSADSSALMPIFCIPKNAKLLGYWDQVADRLFKLRNCMNIEGDVRQLPLFEPPIDPALLVRASAQGLDLNNILNNIDAPLPHYRFQMMSQKANELCNLVKGLGSQLLSVLERRDSEELSLLRSGQELNILKLIRDIKRNQVSEAKENLKSINAARVITEEKLNYFGNKEYLNESEKSYFKLTSDSTDIQNIVQVGYALASLGHLVPNLKIGSGFTFGVTTGGGNIGHAAKIALDSGELLANLLKRRAELANMKGGYDRRQEDWDYQADTAKFELKQIDKQITAAEIRLEISEKELSNHDVQIANSNEADEFMRSKFSNYELYDWMAGKISSVYFQSYQLAHDFAKKAERCYQHELGNKDSFISYGYWDSLMKGLQSADHLIHDLQRMETSYIDKNIREYELNKTVSLSMLDPLALIELKETGKCEFTIPEAFYDLDYAGHYFRRLKSVSISLPCIAGPYTSVSATLTLKEDMYRKNKTDIEPYAVITDERFFSNKNNPKSIVTSSAQNDSGVFELNFRDERYLPFEGAGAISTWILELPSTIRQFDYTSISDALLHVKYTAKNGGDVLKTVAESALSDQLKAIQGRLENTGLHTAINLKNDLPNEWHLLLTEGSTSLKIEKSRLPYMAQALSSQIESVIFIAKIKDNPDEFMIGIDEVDAELNNSGIDWGLVKSAEIDIELGASFSLSVEPGQLNKLEDMIMLVKFSF